VTWPQAGAAAAAGQEVSWLMGGVVQPSRGQGRWTRPDPVQQRTGPIESGDGEFRIGCCEQPRGAQALVH
jgi:hypothetical protein